MLVPAAAPAEVGPAHDDVLSPRLAELARPSVRSAPPDAQAERLSVAAEGPGSLLRDGNRILADVRFAQGAEAGAASLQAAGAEIVHVSDRYRTVTVSARPADLPRLADVPGVDDIGEIFAPIAAASACGGLVTSEGDSQLGAASARNAFNVEGEGVTVGVLSDSYDTAPEAPTGAAEDVASGDLPGAGNPCDRTDEVDVLEDFVDLVEPTIDEGRAMSQVVHDLAPAASLAFATAFTGELGFADNIRRLAAPPAAGGAGAEVLVDDISYLEDPFFQDGPIGVAIDDVTSAGADYFSSAGNDNLIDAEGNDISTWEAPEFRDAPSCPPELEALGPFEVCMDFDPGEEPGEVDNTFGITVEEDEVLTVDLQWAEPWEAVDSDIDVYLLDDEDNPLPFASTDDNLQTQRPAEIFGWENDTGEPQEVRLAINRCFGPLCNPGASETTKPRLKVALIQNGAGVSATEYPKSAEGDVVGPAIFGHSGASDAISVAAVPFNDSSEVEEYSSRGPVTHYFGPASGPAPALPLAEPLEILKPDLAATDCGLTTFFFEGSVPGLFRFCGTSASAPHAAAVAALMKEANPSISGSQLRTALAASAKPVDAFGPTAVGAGLVDAFGAVSRVALPPEVEVTEPPEELSANPTPTIGFVASRPVTFACTIDEGVPIPCSSPFVPATPLEDGEHSFAASGTDLAGRSGTSELEAFTIDTTAPSTFFRKHPKKLIRTEKTKVKATFRFAADEAGATFVCRIDGAPFRECAAKLVRKFKRGKHKVRVKARDALGNTDSSPAVFSFRVDKPKG